MSRNPPIENTGSNCSKSESFMRISEKVHWLNVPYAQVRTEGSFRFVLQSWFFEFAVATLKDLNWRLLTLEANRIRNDMELRCIWNKYLSVCVTTSIMAGFGLRLSNESLLSPVKIKTRGEIFIDISNGLLVGISIDNRYCFYSSPKISMHGPTVLHLNSWVFFAAPQRFSIQFPKAFEEPLSSMLERSS